ncbi:hypothetical protein KO516_16995 [Citreicella sp. C3M06]|uniref:hypothetical protein n=1 Tax=Citreicella sp. C3M06 TaxID=2841564 RepID=UPI001C08D578|nr:hypothetical protein [Citreicella sp. C3M06]MBU2962489.1 hypothetical protein [Citreicella sp. C3M06]
MPKLIRLYIVQVVAGFALSAVFVGLLLWLNVANLYHLVTSSEAGLLAVFLLWLFNGLVFAGVQFAISIMRMGDDGAAPPGGKRMPGATMAPATVRIKAPSARGRPL